MAELKDILADSANGILSIFKNTQQVATEDDVALKEDSLGNPTTDGDGLSSTTGGTRSWVAFGLQSAVDLKADITAVGITIGTASPLTNFWTGSQAQYDGLTPDAETIYFIV